MVPDQINIVAQEKQASLKKVIFIVFSLRLINSLMLYFADDLMRQFPPGLIAPLLKVNFGAEQ